MTRKAKRPASIPALRTKTPLELLPIGTGTFSTESRSEHVIRATVRYGAWERDSWDCTQLTGSLTLAHRPSDGEENTLVIETSRDSMGIDVLELEEFDAYVTLLSALRDELFASGFISRARLAPFPEVTP